MRCLYCGKELALLKRWTSGGEFCSDAHRQQYQEEYTQLALNRLLQAKPLDPKPKAGAKVPETPAESKPGPPASSTAPEPARQVSRHPARAIEPEHKPAPRPAEEEPAPAQAGFFLELPIPVAAATAELVAADVAFERRFEPKLPQSAPCWDTVPGPGEPAVAVNSAGSKPAPAYHPAASAAPTPAPAAKAPEAVPAAPSRPLPVTLHGLPAGRGKPVQVFTSPVAGELGLQVPRSTALPLRSVMTLGAAPAAAKVILKDPPEEPVKQEVKQEKDERKLAVERATMVKPDPRRQPGRPDPRFSNGKGRKPEPEPQRERAGQPKAAAAAVREPEPLPAKEPESVPAFKAQPSPSLDLPSLTLDSGGGFWSKLPAAGKAGIAAGGVLALAVILFAVSRGGAARPVSAAPQIVEGPALSAVESGWITDWGAEPGVRREHEISVLRPSLNLTDYRLQFEAQIESKALGWVYRAQDGKNYYINKLEIVKPGLDPAIALVRFAVINGQEQPRAQLPLALPVHLDTLYKIRFDAVGDRFTTYVQDQKVDEWTDDRLKMGGIGLYNERGERMSLKGTVNVVPLVIKK